MSLPSSDSTEDFAEVIDPRFGAWRRAHRAASFVLGALAVLHIGVTARIYDAWVPDAVWFVGAGLGLLLLAVVNVAHIGLGPCRMPTAPAIRAANWVFALFGIAASVAVPEPQAFVIVLVLLVQAVASHRTLIGAG